MASVLPEASHEVRGVTPDVGNLTAYQHLVGETASDVLPAGFIHALAFPLAISVMNRDDFPLPLLGMVHLSNHVNSGHRSCSRNAGHHGPRGEPPGPPVGDAAGRGGRGPRHGTAGVKWRGVSTYLAKGVFLPGIDKPRPWRRRDFKVPDPDGAVAARR